MFTSLHTLSSVFFVVITGLVATLLMKPFGIRLATYMNLLDVPGSEPHKQHRKATPLAGGIILFFAVLVVFLAARAWEYRGYHTILLPALVIFLFGLRDDKKRLNPSVKLVGQFLAAVLFLLLGESIHIIKASFLENLIPGIHIWVNYIITIIWLVGITNAFNFLDSMDGIVAGVGTLSFLFFLLFSLQSNQPELSIICAGFLGICVGLLFHNSIPANLFLGDSGAQTIGFTLAAIGILYTPSDINQASSWFVPILVLGLPIFDTTLVVLSRIRRKLVIYKGHLDHTFHRLVALGLEPNRAVLAMHMTTLVLGCVAFICLTLSPAISNGIFGLFMIMGSIAVLFLDRKSQWQNLK